MQVVNRLRDAEYKFKRRGERVEIYRQRGTGQRVNVPLRDLLDEAHACLILKQAGLTAEEIEAFIRDAVKVR